MWMLVFGVDHLFRLCVFGCLAVVKLQEIRSFSEVTTARKVKQTNATLQILQMRMIVPWKCEAE